MVFWVFPCLHYFVNILANFNSIIKFLYIFPQPKEWAVRKCPQLILRMLQGLRNSQKTITPFFWNTLYDLFYLKCFIWATGCFKKKVWSFLSISQPLKHPQNKLRAFSNSPFRGLLENVQKLNDWVKIGRDIYKIVKTREKSKCQKCWIFET